MDLFADRTSTATMKANSSGCRRLDGLCADRQPASLRPGYD